MSEKTTPERKRVLSHCERCAMRFKNSSPEKRDTVRKVRISVYDEETSRMVTKIEFKTIDRVEEMKPFKVSDFYLENLLAIGASLTPSHMAASPHKAVSDMIATLETITTE